MRRFARWVALITILLGGWAVPPRLALAAQLDTSADRVFGQADFTHGDANRGHASPNARSLDQPAGVAVDAHGDLYVSDFRNNRVLEYDAPLSSGMAASRVFGQTNFTDYFPDRGQTSPGANTLALPKGLAFDAQGNLYVADTGNSRVLEYDDPLTHDTRADRVFGQADFTHGQPNRGHASPSDRSLYDPSGLAFDAQGNLYVGDTFNNRVIEFDDPASSDTVADRVFGQADFSHKGVNRGNGATHPSADSLHNPYGVALDAQGNLYVGDNLNSRVLEYDTPLTLNTVADRVFGQPDFAHFLGNHGAGGHGPASADSLFLPYEVRVDARGNLYVADTYNSRLLEYDNPLTHDTTADRVFGQVDFTHMDGNRNQNTASAKGLLAPQGLALDAHGNLFVADGGNNRALEYDLPLAHGAPKLSGLSPATVAAGSPKFTLAVTGSDFVASSVVRWNGSDRPTTYWSSTQLSAAISAADVAAGGPFAVTVFTPAPGGGTSSALNLTLYARAGGDGHADMQQGQPDFKVEAINNTRLLAAGRLNQPNAVAVRAATGRLFVADSLNNRVLSWPDAAARADAQPADLVFGQPDFFAIGPNDGGRSRRSLDNPSGVAVDAAGNLYVADTGNQRVLEYDAPLVSGMAASRVFGQGGSFSSGGANHGGLSQNSLSLPFGLALDAAGNLYVADYGNNRVLEYDAPLTTDTTADRVFGQADFTHSAANRGSGSPSADGLYQPMGVALDATGDLYVADEFNQRVLEYNNPLAGDATADRVFGQADFTHNSCNRGNAAPSADSLCRPTGLALDGLGNLYVVDHFNQRVLEYVTPLATGMDASRVFGQANFSHGAANRGNANPNDNSLNDPLGATLDAQNNLYVADTLNHRVLEFDWATP